MNAIYRKYLKGTPPKIECVGEDTRALIWQKLQESQEPPDANLLDGAQNEVVEYMASTSYIKFFESDVYIKHLQVRETLHTAGIGVRRP